MRIHALLVGLLLAATLLSAQTRWETGALIAATNYFGDFSPENIVSTETHLGYGAFARLYVHPAIALRVDCLRGEISGKDLNFPLGSPERDRGFDFKNKFSEASAMLEWEPFGLRHALRKKFRPGLSPYLNVGYGLIFHQPKTHFHDELEPLPNPELGRRVAEDRAARNIGSASALCFGLGNKIYIAKNIAFGAEIIVRKTFTDYLDGVSMAGNSGNKDWLFTGSFMLSYRFYQAPRDRDHDGLVDWRDKRPDVRGKKRNGGCPDDEIAASSSARRQTGPQTKRAEKTKPLPKNEAVVATKQAEKAQPAPSQANAPDADGDRIPDAIDKCPNEPGHVLFNGCPDRDGDQVPDQEDECPEIAGDLNNKGCPR